MERKYFKFKLDGADSDTGTITGHGSVAGNRDLAGEVVAPGAFKRTLAATAGKLPMLFNHSSNEPIGLWSEMTEDGKGLKVKGQINMEVARGREIYALLKQGALSGLSIGYDVLQDAVVKGVRHLTEVKLWEVSVVVFPANERAAVSTVKSASAALAKFIPAFDESNDWNQIYAARSTMLGTLDGIFSSVMFESEMGEDEIAASLDSSLAQFHAAALAWAQQARAVVAAQNAAGKSLTREDSLAHLNQHLARSIDEVKALLKVQDGKADSGEAAHSDEPTESAGLAADAPDDTVGVPDLSLLIDTIRAATPSASHTSI